ncbi:hypothetical protein LDL77_08315 [Flagellimonas marinaquae]|nr:hypothetical protein [Allomuricauda abyssi]UBZ16135.1 hypothetical protein LDL77_08315 [Allomuricauda aquimarina]
MKANWINWIMVEEIFYLGPKRGLFWWKKYPSVTKEGGGEAISFEGG